jgi:hypothetical protein
LGTFATVTADTSQRPLTRSNLISTYFEADAENPYVVTLGMLLIGHQETVVYSAVDVRAKKFDVRRDSAHVLTLPHFHVQQPMQP